MKIYNKTKYPDSLLEKLLIQAGKSIGARTSNVVVIVNSTKPGYNRCYGTAYKCNYVNLKDNLIETDNGYFKITIPYPFVPTWVDLKIQSTWIRSRKFDGLTIAYSILTTAAHEWQHIKQYQENKFDFKNKKERNKNHDNRIWEKDAIKASSKVNKNPNNRIQESVLDLALWIEENKKKEICIEKL